MSRPPVPGRPARADRFDHLSQNVRLTEKAVEGLGYL
jgi:hypothetical protein